MTPSPDSVTSETKSRPSLQVGLHYPVVGTISCCILLVLVLGLVIYRLNTVGATASLADIFIVFIFVVLLVIGFSLRERSQFLNRVNALQAEIDQLEKERHFTWQSKQDLQQRCSQYSKQADKLSRFISEKMMDQIDYEEEFYHLKNTAIEILQKGKVSHELVEKALAETQQQGVERASEASAYLWDLLQLAAVDDVGGMIAKDLVRCEERFYQIKVNKVEPQTDTLPYFAPYIAMLKAIGPMLSPEALETLVSLIDKTENHEVSLFETDKFRFHLQDTEHLLGNLNHVVLLIEHLVQNAESLAAQASFSQSTDRIAVRLNQNDEGVALSVYHRGSQLNEAEQQRLFKMGSEQGLGLYFVSRIVVDGYQGKIAVINTQNREQTFTVRIALESGNILTKVVECRCLNEVPKLRELDEMHHEALVESVSWSWQSRIVSIEVASSREQQTQFFDQFEAGNNQFLDPKNPYTPEWQLGVQQDTESVDITLTALDIRGVRLEVILPSAESFLKQAESDAKST